MLELRKATKRYDGKTVLDQVDLTLAEGQCTVLRVGSWATTTRLLSMSHRNFFEPFRNDIISGFRSCSLD